MGKAELFGDIRVFIEEEKGSIPYEDVAVRQGKSLTAVKSEIRRLRLRYGQKLREVVGETVVTSSDVDSELADLLRVLGEHDNG
jgi:hypothetical protein